MKASAIPFFEKLCHGANSSFSAGIKLYSTSICQRQSSQRIACSGFPRIVLRGLFERPSSAWACKHTTILKSTYVEAAVDQAKVTFADGRIDTYDWVVACDGKHSSTREQLGIGYEGYDLSELWSIADIDLNEDFDCERIQYWIQGENGQIATCLPIERFRARAPSSTPNALAAIPLDLGVTNVRRAGTFEISVRQATSYTKGCILLAGDAAHCHSPVGGRGMNLGIGDAVAAAQAILNGTTESYGDKRHVAGATILKMTEATRSKFCLNRIIDRVRFNVMMRLGQNVSLLHPVFVRQLTRMP